jgi:Fusaric acid resistance protein-like
MSFASMDRIRSALVPFFTRERIRSARPAFSNIARLTTTATFAYLLALVIPAGTSRPVLAPLTALLVLQASLYQTMRSGLRKVASVTVGVLVAVGVAEFIGFSWWQLALVIAAALVIGRVLRLGEDLLEVPISAMLIFSSAGPADAGTGRVVDTLVGTAAGLAGGLVFGKPRVQPAREAVGTLAGRLADLLSRMARELAEPGECAAASGSGSGSADGTPDGDGPRDADGQTAAVAPGPDCVAEWLTQARALRDEIERVDGTLRKAADSVRFNPRSVLSRGVRPSQRSVPDDLVVTEVALRGGLETLEHATVTVRGLARSILDSAEIDSDRSPVRDEQTRARMAGVLGQLAQAFRTYGQLVQLYPAEAETLRWELAQQLAAAHGEQDALAAALEPRVPEEGGSSEWPLRGEILNHVDRLRTGLQPDSVLRPEPARPLPRTRGRRGRRPAVTRDRDQRRSREQGHRREQRRDRKQRHDRDPGRDRKRGRAGRVARYWVRERISAQRAR